MWLCIKCRKNKMVLVPETKSLKTTLLCLPYVITSVVYRNLHDISFILVSYT